MNWLKKHQILTYLHSRRPYNWIGTELVIEAFLQLISNAQLTNTLPQFIKVKIIDKTRPVCIYSLSFENLASSLVVFFPWPTCLANQVSGMCAQAREWNLAIEKDWSQEDEYEAWGQVLAVMFDHWAKEGWAYAVKKWQWASGISLC